MVFEKITKRLKKLTFSALEPTFHVFMGYLLNKKLEKMEEKDTISKFKSRIIRTSKHHYKMELELFLTEKQAKKSLNNLAGNLPTSLKEVIFNGRG